MGSDQLQQLCDAVVGVKAKIASLEQAMRDGAARVGEVEAAVASVGSQVSGFKQALPERMSGSQGRILTLDLDRNVRPRGDLL